MEMPISVRIEYSYCSILIQTFQAFRDFLYCKTLTVACLILLEDMFSAQMLLSLADMNVYDLIRLHYLNPDNRAA